MDFIFLKRLLGELAVPPASVLLLILLGWLIGRRWQRLGRGVSLAGVLALWLLSTPIVAGWLAQGVEEYPPLDLRQRVDAQAIVILAGGTRREAKEYAGDAPRPATLQRITYGSVVARATQLPVAVSGGTVLGGEAEALVMKTFLERDFKVPVAWAETASRDTRENALYTFRMLQPQGIRRIVLVTTSAHMRRAVQEFRAAGFEVVPAPTDFAVLDEFGLFRFVPMMQALGRSQVALHELLGETLRSLIAGR